MKKLDILHERITARTILVNKKNEILLLKFQLPHETFWLTPGGKIENNETPLAAAQRELWEETGIADAHYIVPHSYYSETIGNLHGIPTQFKEHIFLAYTENEQLNQSYLEEQEKEIIVAAQWWDLHDFLITNETFRPYNLLTVLSDVIYKKQYPTKTISLLNN